MWNLENRFTGWVDVDLSPQGVLEAQAAAHWIQQENLNVGIAYTSYLKRAIKTLWTILDENNLHALPVCQAWELNERHYGALQGLNKAETAQKYGEEQVHIWRRSFSTLPPLLERIDPTHPMNDKKYAAIDQDCLPQGESLSLTVDRVVPFYQMWP